MMQSKIIESLIQPLPKEMSFIKFMKERFMLPGETLTQFAVQLKALTAEDRAWFAMQAFVEFGVTITTAPATAAA